MNKNNEKWIPTPEFILQVFYELGKNGLIDGEGSQMEK